MKNKTVKINQYKHVLKRATFTSMEMANVCKTGSVFGFEVFQGQQYKRSIPQVDCQENMTNQKQGLKKHSKPVHEGLTYRCTESDNQAKSQEPLRKHMKDHHIRNHCLVNLIMNRV